LIGPFLEAPSYLLLMLQQLLMLHQLLKQLQQLLMQHQLLKQLLLPCCWCSTSC